MTDQAKADKDMTMEQRMALAGGSVVSGGGAMVADGTGIQAAGDATKVVGKINRLKTGMNLYQLFMKP